MSNLYYLYSNTKWSPTAVWIIASSPFYAGIYRYNRYKGAEHRTENPEDEWVMVSDHHPAIFTVEEYEVMSNMLKDNSRGFSNYSDLQHSSSRVHLFSGIAYCGKCGNKMVSTTGKLCVDGYRPSNCSCPKRRKTKDCDNQTINDSALGEFVIISEGPGNRKPLFSRKSNNSAKKKNARNGLCRDSRNSTCILNLQCGKSKKNPWIP